MVSVVLVMMSLASVCILSVVLVLLASKDVSSFSVVRSSNAEKTVTKKCISGAGTAIWSSFSAQETSAPQEEETPKQQQQKAPLSVPLTWNEMVRQAANAMKEAEQDGVTRQIFRVLLPRDASSTDLLRFFEDDKQAVEESPETAAQERETAEAGRFPLPECAGQVALAPHRLRPRPVHCFA